MTVPRHSVLRPEVATDPRTVREVMSRPVMTVATDASVCTAAALMRRHQVGALPVCREGMPVGILTDRDIAVRAAAEGRDLATTRVEEVMTLALCFIPPDASLIDAACMMRVKRIRRLAVLDDVLRLVGILAEEDLQPKP